MLYDVLIYYALWCSNDNVLFLSAVTMCLDTTYIVGIYVSFLIVIVLFVYLF